MFNKIITPALIIAAGLITASCTPSDADIEKIVIETIKKKPEIIVQALTDYQNQEQEKTKQASTETIKTLKNELENDKYSLILGNPKGDVTVVAFEDYRCGYCKHAWNDTQDLLASDNNVRLVIKELPILGAPSFLAAQYALASEKQGKYKEVYSAFMGHNGEWDEKTLQGIVSEIGVDVARLKIDTRSPDIEKHLSDNIALAGKLAINGTPAFIIGEQFFPGAIPLDAMKSAILKERSEKK